MAHEQQRNRAAYILAELVASPQMIFGANTNITAAPCRPTISVLISPFDTSRTAAFFAALDLLPGIPSI